MNKKITLTKNTQSVKYLCSKDKKLNKLINIIGNISYIPYGTNNSYSFLVQEIIEQMLSMKAGQKIYERLKILCNGKITPNNISNLTFKEIRSIGTSNSKANYILNLTEAIICKKIKLSKLKNLPDEEIIKHLTSIKGIGIWTAKMYLIFVLNRQDVLPVEDGAFAQAYKWLYKTADYNKQTVIKRCKKWKPYSSIAARYLYKALNTNLTKTDFYLFK